MGIDSMGAGIARVVARAGHGPVGWTPPDLRGRVAVVAGATRGCGRGIAVSLGEAGATVYCTGRSVRGAPAMKGRPETIEETAALVNVRGRERGGAGIAVQVDHTVRDEVRVLFERVAREQDGRLDVLVNDVWGGEELIDHRGFWAHPDCLDKGLRMQERAVWSHIITSHYGVPLVVAQGRGLVVEVTDGTGYGYREVDVFYSLAKVSAIHLADAMSRDLREHGADGVTVVAVTPGYLRSEAMLDGFGVTEDNWREAVKKDPDFAFSETPYLLGRAVASLAADERVGERNGKALSSWELAQEYGFGDADGTQPVWGARRRIE